MSMIISPETPYGKELWKWDHLVTETHPSDPMVKGMRPATPQAYPMRLYKITQKNPWVWDAETVADERERRNLESRGFVAGGLAEAVKAYDTDMTDLATAAAHRNWEDRNMSESAKARTQEVEQASSRHVGEIPAEPIPAHRKRGRKPKSLDVTP